MSSPVVPFSTVLSGFDSQIASFSSMATNGLNTPALLTASPTSTTSSITNALSNPLGTMTGAAVSSAANALFSTRVVAILLGLISIAGAIFLFKSPEIIEATKSAAKTSVAL